MMKTNETSNPIKLYSKHYNSYCIWDGTMYKNDGKVSGANFYSLEKAANNGFLPIEKTTREQALEWWNKISLEQRFYKVIPWSISKGLGASEIHPDHLTNYEIEEIWRKEKQQNLDFINAIPSDDNKPTKEEYDEWEKFDKAVDKLNQKQFKKFDSDLFERYITKFNDIDQAQMLHLFLCHFYRKELLDSFEVDNEFSLHLKEVLKNLFSKVS